MEMEALEPKVVEKEAEEQQTQSEESGERTESEISEEEDSSFHDIKLLLEHGISRNDIAILKKNGINTIKGIQMTISKKLLMLGFNQMRITAMKEACSKIAMNTGFMTAADVCNQRRQIFKLSTGSNNLDILLGGGIEAMAITEVSGEFGSGKTQLAHTLCVTAQMPGLNGYLGGKVIYIDTEHTFRPERLRPIAERFCLDQTTVLENILYARAYNSEHQFELLKNVAAKLHEEAGIFKLLIIDSIMALFRVDYSGVKELADRQQKLAQMLGRLQQISEEYNIAIYITNQITSDVKLPHVEGDDLKDASKPAGGNIVAHASTVRVFLKKGKDCMRFATLMDSPDLEASTTSFLISKGGIDDAFTF